MPDERRSGARAALSGIRVSYESATGERLEADATDLAAGGLFVSTDAPLAVGKRLALELHVFGEPAPWSGVARVAWVRETSEGEGRPAGMGVKLIDADESTLAAIARLVEEREEPGSGAISVAPPAVLEARDPEAVPAAEGLPAPVPESESAAEPAPLAEPVAAPESEPVPEPAAEPAPIPEAVVEAPPAPPPEAVVVAAVEAVAVEAAPAPPKSAPEPPAAPASIRPRPGGAPNALLVQRRVLLLLFAVVAGVVGYVFYEGFLWPMR